MLKSYEKVVLGNVGIAVERLGQSMREARNNPTPPTEGDIEQFAKELHSWARALDSLLAGHFSP